SSATQTCPKWEPYRPPLRDSRVLRPQIFCRRPRVPTAFVAARAKITESQMSFALSLPCAWQYFLRTGKRCPRIFSYACLYCPPGSFRLSDIVHKRKVKLSWAITAVRLVLLLIYTVFTGHG